MTPSYFFAGIVRAAARLPLRFSLSSIFVAIAAIALILAWNVNSQGSVPIHTGRELDLAIFGIGYFQVVMPNGQICYTRHGRFSLNSNGQIVIGRPADDIHIRHDISVPQDCKRILVSPDGTVNAELGNSGSFYCVGRVEIARFVSPDGLVQVAPDVWGSTEASGPALTIEPGDKGTGFVYQGWLEPAAGPPREQLRYQLCLIGTFALGLWLVFQNRAMRHDLAALRQKLEIA